MLETWSRLGDAPFARVNHQAIFLDDFLYVFGGFNSQLKDLQYCAYQLDVFKWDVKNNQWEEVKYPLCLKSWDCSTNYWGPDPLISSDGSIQPTLRFGHTVVAWRGRGWLFGGRTQQHVCSNQLYMFYPGRSPCSPIPGSQNDPEDPLWVEVVGAHGAVPTARDGHAATVLESSMFIFGGFEDVFGGYDNLVYRLDFLSWTWTRIHINNQVPATPLRLADQNAVGNDVDAIPAELERGLQENVGNEIDAVDAGFGSSGEEQGLPDLVISTRVPLPRDFACLMSHQGRIFLFGGRSECSSRSGHDVYDSTLWELVPIPPEQYHDHQQNNRSTEGECHWKTAHDGQSKDRASPACCSTRFADWKHMAWEEESGNWESSDFWATSPGRPSCLWGQCSASLSRPSPYSVCRTSSESLCLPTQLGCPSRWSTSEAVWQQRHPGHGLQLPDQLLPRLFRSASHHALGTVANRTASAAKLNVSSPYGRRSLSHWCYGGYLYVAFGTVRCQTGDQWQLHYEDVWRFSLATDSWSLVSYSLTPTSISGARDGIRAHLPSARRRAVACLHLPRANRRCHQGHPFYRPKVFLFGGTQPCLLSRHGDSSPNPTSSQPPMSGPLRVASFFPRRTDAQAIAALSRQLTGSDNAGNVSEPLSQNRILPILSFRTNPRQLPSTADSVGGIVSCPPLRSPYVILLIDHTDSAMINGVGGGTLLHLVVVMPPLSTQATINNSPGNVPPLACLCVTSLTDCLAFIQASHYGQNPKGVGFLSRLFTTATSESDMSSRSSTSSSLSEPIHSLSPDERVHLRTALHLALTAVDDRSLRRNPVNRQTTSNSQLPIRLSLVIQQSAMESEVLDPMSLRHPSDLMRLSCAGGSGLAIILEQHIFYLPVRESTSETGTIHTDPLDSLRSQIWFRRLPSSRLALYTALYMLRDSARLLSSTPNVEDGALIASITDTTASTSSGNGISSRIGTSRLRAASSLSATTALCYDCYFGNGTGDDTPSVSPARVLIDASQLTTIATQSVGNQPASLSAGDGDQSISDSGRSVASILAQHLLSHVRVGLELLPIMMMDSQVLMSTRSTTMFSLDTFLSRATSLAPIPSAGSSVSFPSSMWMSHATPDAAVRSEVNSEGGHGDGQEDTEMLEEAFVSASAGTSQRSVSSIDFAGSSRGDWNSLPPVHLPVLRQQQEPPLVGGVGEAGIDAQVEAGDAGDSSSSSVSGSLNDSAEHGRSDGSIFFVPGVGVLVRGKERLMELNDCYVMHLETSLYDLCLRRMRELRPSIPVLLSVPSHILHDLAALHYTSGLAEFPGREANSG